ncbi:hypothetical protein [Jejuia pallidilutea]|uniref:Uncharacterized protein n=1 Tax=Jejuia pallidilutea TaxID=504487 RepID=A0A090W8F7_9FLAO|nr:hypothetical protein [Jejuia pallidilutea]GAL67113.1 hypothetical protein JCM19301_2278 [Jejuia pallidilutea]GAL73226.1 hypothetical protein JCM19302_2087 [Jejuia pallidilutea]GAL90674.1 hypothetical protein JCM19538_439 [Jejuia pallidilutea]
MSNSSTIKPPIWFWIVSIIALIWNGMGVNAYLQQAYDTESYRAMYSEEQLEIAANMPAWVTAAFAIAVFAGTVASLGLLLRKSWSVKLWMLSLIAVIVQMGYILINGYASSMGMTIMIIVFAFFFVWFARKSEANGWLS